MERINLPLVVEKPEISTNTLLLQHPWVPKRLQQIIKHCNFKDTEMFNFMSKVGLNKVDL